MHQRIVGIDVGLKGAVAIMDNGKLLSVADLPTATVAVGKKDRASMFVPEIMEMIKPLKPNTQMHVFIERQQYTGDFEKMTRLAQANYMETYGRLYGNVEGRGWSLTLVPPVTWIPAVKAPSGKDGHIIRFCQLFPSQSWLLKGARGQPKDGRADAALIAYYGHLFLNKGHF